MTVRGGFFTQVKNLCHTKSHLFDSTEINIHPEWDWEDIGIHMCECCVVPGSCGVLDFCGVPSGY